ncbi:hypothetical protein GWI34_03390 [Actinomadura sp. DSM 109109]|nr:hypothetical protein [Actinomadura lepetitiana]
MPEHRFTRVPIIRTLITAFAWLVVLATALGASSALGDTNPRQALGVVTAATGVTALLALVVLRLLWTRGVAGVPRTRAAEISASWRAYRGEILYIAIFPVLGGYAALLMSDQDLRRYAPTVPLLIGAAVLFYTVAVRTVRSMKSKAESGAYHHPVLGVVLGSLLGASISLPTLVAFTAMTWQAVVSCAIAGAATFVAALFTLWAAPAAKN